MGNGVVVCPSQLLYAAPSPPHISLLLLFGLRGVFGGGDVCTRALAIPFLTGCCGDQDKCARLNI